MLKGFGFLIEDLTEMIDGPLIENAVPDQPRLQYLRFASVSLYPSNEDVSLAVSRILKSFNYPSASLICAKAECEGEWFFLISFSLI